MWTKVADLFEEIVLEKAAIPKQGKLTGNDIQKYVDASPRVENSEFPSVPDRLVVACPPAVVTSSVDQKHPMPTLPNYITKRPTGRTQFPKEIKKSSGPFIHPRSIFNGGRTNQVQTKSGEVGLMNISKAVDL